MHKLVIGAPFGNYIEFDNATSTMGTFTTTYRGGWLKRLYKVLRTVRYYPGIQAWKNKLGLPNPGIFSLAGYKYPTKIISIAGFNEEEWLECARVAKACKPLAIELNISCPNCPGEDRTDYTHLFSKLMSITGDTEVIVKLPPVSYERRLQQAIYGGVTSFHCCNTLFTPGGGLSGKPLKLLSLRCIETVKTSNSVVRIIGGGGITHQCDVDDYINAGCTNVSVASVLFNPFNWCRIKRIARTITTSI